MTVPSARPVPEREPHATDLAGRPIWPFAAVLGVCALLGLGKQLWYDEAYTLLCYVSTGPLYSLTHYQAPNNHVLFSALLGALPLPHMEPLYRLVPILCSAGAVALIMAATARLAPASTRRTRAAVVFATLLAFPSFLSFATQIRGYALAMLLLAASLVALLAAWRREGWWTTPMYAAAGALTVATVPTSFLTLAALGLADVITWRRRRAGWRELGSVLVRQLATSAGLLIYLPTWREVIANATRGWAWQSPAVWLPDLGLALVLPGLVVPLCWLLVRRTPAPRSPSRGPDAIGTLALASAAVVVALAAAGAHLFPRSFSGFIPVVVALVAAVTLRIGRHRPTAVWTAALLAAVIGQAYWHAGTRLLWDEGRPRIARRLLPPYFESTWFDPAETAVAVAAAGGDRFVALVDNRDRFSDEMSVWYYAALAGIDSNVVLGPRNLPPPSFPLDRLRVLIVSRDAAGRDGLLAFLGRPGARCHAVKATGHFKVWRLDT